MKKIWGWLMLLMVLCIGCAHAESAFPEALRFTPAQMVETELDDDHTIQQLLPTTHNAQVNADLSALHEQMMQEALPRLLSAEKTDKDQAFTLRLSTAILRTGTKWMSFYTTAAIDDHIDQIYTAFDARVYDMETGKRLTLADVISDAEALKPLIIEDIEAYFPDESPVIGDLTDLDFTVTPGSLRFHFRADAFYPDKNTLLHVKLYYPEINAFLTEEARQQTDNSDRPHIALTFDDGPARSRTTAVMDLLKGYGADATFFMVGERLASDAATVKWQHDSCFDLACHSFSHYTRTIPPSQVREELRLFDEALVALTGKGASILRAPGGYEEPYTNADIAMPLIHWSVASGDGSANRRFDKRGLEEIFDQVTWHAKDGAVVLFHDLRKECPLYLEPILQYLEENGFLCVTVEELFSIQGIPLEPNTVYNDAFSKEP